MLCPRSGRSEIQPILDTAMHSFNTPFPPVQKSFGLEESMEIAMTMLTSAMNDGGVSLTEKA